MMVRCCVCDIDPPKVTGVLNSTYVFVFEAHEVDVASGNVSTSEKSLGVIEANAGVPSRPKKRASTNPRMYLIDFIY
jgi:hypothetical protein